MPAPEADGDESDDGDDINAVVNFEPPFTDGEGLRPDGAEGERSTRAEDEVTVATNLTGEDGATLKTAGLDEDDETAVGTFAAASLDPIDPLDPLDPTNAPAASPALGAMRKTLAVIQGGKGSSVAGPFTRAYRVYRRFKAAIDALDPSNGEKMLVFRMQRFCSKGNVQVRWACVRRGEMHGG